MYIINFRMTGEKNRKESKVRNVTSKCCWIQVNQFVCGKS